jgi:uncharacterized repeat protein (TIGR01451 family)
MITYAYTVTNTGNVDETSVSVSDPTLGKVNCPAPAAPGLAPGSSETCTAATTVTVSQRDVDAGSLTDTATAGCLDALGAACGPSTQSTVVIPAVSAEPLTSVKKTATITRQADRHKARRGDKIRYSFKVTNIGNVDLTTVRVTDTTLGAVSCPVPLAPGLAPGASETCTGKRTYRVSGADVTAGKVVNDATSTGTDPQGQVSAVSNQTQTTVATIAAGPMLTKTPSVRRARAGGKVTYTLIVRNRSAIAMSSVTVCDSLPQTLLFDRASPRARLSTGRYCWSLRRLAGHARRSLRITVWVTPSHGGNVTNHATATARDTLTTHASATIQVTRAPRVPCGSAADHSAFRARGPDAYAAC